MVDPKYDLSIWIKVVATCEGVPKQFFNQFLISNLFRKIVDFKKVDAQEKNTG